MNKYDTPVQYVKGVGEKRAKLLEKLGIHNLYELIHFYPRTYLDFSNPVKISSLTAGSTCCVKAIIGYPAHGDRIRQGMTIYKTVATDETGIMHITIFNNKYAASALETGKEYFFMGKVTETLTHEFEMTNPLIEPFDESLTLTPIYPQTAGLRSKTIEKIMKNALHAHREIAGIDPIPDFIRREYKLCHEQYALSSIHFPKSEKDIQIAKQRLIFEELLVLQAGLLKLRKRNRQQTGAVISQDFSNEFTASLPFSLTGAQQRTIDDCVNDMKKHEPMNRLVQGDVGSGKTVVAASLIYSVVRNGYQCALMAPTEILAVQHFNTLSKMLPDNINVALLTGSMTAKKKNEVKTAIADDSVNVVVGTHAIITDDVKFSSLGLVVTDEQHRFGVKQRGSLSEKGQNPHVLVMSATPIPRTLSLIIYGDLDVSIIDELPKGRQKISTYAVDSSYHKRVYNFVKKHLDKGLQAYIVCPLVEESEAELTAAAQYAEQLAKREFVGYKVGLLHGKMKPKDKKQVMEDFSVGNIQLLVSTTVIEVGIDVPNAVLMVIENADRFGLSQLHQLRGRVGRGSEKSSCVLISDAQGDTAKKRLEIMCRTNDGFLIADEDLKLRGPGDFFGSRQSGLPEMRIANLLEDMVTLRQTQTAARRIFADDPELKKDINSGLADAVNRLFEKNGTTALN
ncbi:MAG: ATP-dependent DNA helicase RecG [Faecalibacterium sp.]|nr:ATP-dependent DNA helicase RecG [Faecalibacterium sp.]